MTISTSVIVNQYTGSGIVGPYSYTFKIFAATDLLLTKLLATGVPSVLAYPADYSVPTSGINVDVGGAITLTVALAVGESLTIEPTSAFLQQTSIRNSSGFFPAVIENEFDLLTRADQVLKRQIDRSVKYPTTDLTLPVELPAFAQRAGLSAYFDPTTGSLTAGSSISSTIVSAPMIPVVTAASLALARTAMGAEPDAARTFSTLQKFPDNRIQIVGSGDVTKIVAFEVDGLTTATTRTVTVPDKSGTLAMTSDIPTSFSSVVFAQTATRTIVNTTTETSLFSTGIGTLTIPANTFTVGKSLRISIKGVFYSNAGFPNITMKVKLAGTTILNTGPCGVTSGAVSNLAFTFESLLTCRVTGGSGTIAGNMDSFYATGTNSDTAYGSGGLAVGIDTTSALVLDVTFQWGTASATNTISTYVATVEII